MDKVSLRQNIFIEIQDKKAGSDMTILPFSIELEFLAKWKQGIGSRHGPTQDMKSEYVDVSVEMHDCQDVRIARDSTGSSVEEDDDNSTLRRTIAGVNLFFLDGY